MLFTPKKWLWGYKSSQILAIVLPRWQKIPKKYILFEVDKLAAKYDVYVTQKLEFNSI